jgi:hypothetical protein
VRAVNVEREFELAVSVERADTFWRRLRGLRGRARLAEGAALWIVPCRGIHTRGMRFPIDALFLDADGRVVDLEENLAPGRIAPVRWRSRSVLELPAGTLRRSRTRRGDRIDFTA